MAGQHLAFHATNYEYPGAGTLFGVLGADYMNTMTTSSV